MIFESFPLVFNDFPIIISSSNIFNDFTITFNDFPIKSRIGLRQLASVSPFLFLLPFAAPHPSRSARFTRLAHPPRPVFRGQPFLHHPCFPVKDIPALTFFQEQETTRERAPERARFLVAVPVLAISYPLSLYILSKIFFCTLRSVEKSVV